MRGSAWFCSLPCVQLSQLARMTGGVLLSCQTLIATYVRQDFFGELAMLGLASGPNGQVCLCVCVTEAHHRYGAP